MDQAISIVFENLFLFEIAFLYIFSYVIFRTISRFFYLQDKPYTSKINRTLLMASILVFLTGQSESVLGLDPVSKIMLATPILVLSLILIKKLSDKYIYKDEFIQRSLCIDKTLVAGERSHYKEEAAPGNYMQYRTSNQVFAGTENFSEESDINLETDFFLNIFSAVILVVYSVQEIGLGQATFVFILVLVFVDTNIIRLSEYLKFKKK